MMPEKSLLIRIARTLDALLVESRKQSKMVSMWAREDVRQHEVRLKEIRDKDRPLMVMG